MPSWFLLRAAVTRGSRSSLCVTFFATDGVRMISQQRLSVGLGVLVDHVNALRDDATLVPEQLVFFQGNSRVPGRCRPPVARRRRRFRPRTRRRGVSRPTRQMLSLGIVLLLELIGFLRQVEISDQRRAGAV